MKFKTTTKYIKNTYNNIVSVGYCDLQYLLRLENPIAYTCGAYGWNYDIYYVNGVTICTGYRGMPGRTAQGIKEYEQKAFNTLHNLNIEYEQRIEKLNKILKEFCILNGGY